ncbi:MAG: hypothetical protein IPP74_10565 [Alphaproteobacteria bacterium]|nr:hypothetical protein [Alphaproteobacteria bacterium]
MKISNTETLNKLQQNSLVVCSINDRLTDEESKNITNELKVNTSVRTIEWNIFHGNDAIYLADVIRVNKSVVTFYSSNSGIGDDDFSCLASALKENTSIRSIYLNSTHITHEGVKCFAEALRVNRAIYSVCISHNTMRDEGIEHLWGVLKKNCSITTLTLKNSGLRLDTLPDDLKGALEDNTTFARLDLSSNDIGDKGIEYLMALLGNNQFINCIDLTDNKITDVGAKLLLEFINNNHSLVWIYLAKNKISPTVAADFKKFLNTKPNILLCQITDKENPEIKEICDMHQQEAVSFLESIRERKFLDDQEIVRIAERFPAIVTLAFVGGHELDVEHTLAAVAYRAFKLGLSLKTSNLRVNFSVDLDDIKDKAQLTRPMGYRHSLYITLSKLECCQTF